MGAELDKGKMSGGSTNVFESPQWNAWRFYKRFGLPQRTTGGFSFVLDWLAKLLAEVRVFSKCLAENGALSDYFPPFFV